jgi:hypothetical protein
MAGPDDIMPVTDIPMADLENVPEAAKKLLEGYSKIPADEVLPHILQVVCRFKAVQSKYDTNVYTAREWMGHCTLF